jgi:hypothetical protein
VTAVAPSSTLAVRRAGTEVSRFLNIMTTAPRIDLDPDGPTVSVIIPTRNEERNLTWVARHMPANTHEIIVVDGGSTDGTVETAQALWPSVRIIQQTRRGKGNALACGFHAATGEVIVMIDADGSMDPGEIPYFVEALRSGADYAKGSRFTTGGGSSDITALRAWGNRRLNGVTAMVHGTVYSDLCYGFNAFWKRLLPILDLDPGVAGERSDARLWGDGFEVETLINIRVHAAGVRIAEVPSFEHERLYGMSNLNTFRDGLRVLRTIGLEKLVRRRHDARKSLTGGSQLAVTGPFFPDATSDDPTVSLSVTGDLPASATAALTTVAPDRDRDEASRISLESEILESVGQFHDALTEPALFELPVGEPATDGEIAAEFDLITVELAQAEQELQDVRHAA